MYTLMRMHLRMNGDPFGRQNRMAGALQPVFFAVDRNFTPYQAVQLRFTAHDVAERRHPTATARDNPELAGTDQQETTLGQCAFVGRGTPLPNQGHQPHALQCGRRLIFCRHRRNAWR